MNKICVITSGAPGSGKSFFASYLQYLNPSAIICCADDLFEIDGEYKWDADKLVYAHQRCKEKFIKALEDECPLVICANTNAQLAHRQFFIDKAREIGYTVFSLGIENLGTINQHGVPEETVKKMANSLKQNFRF